MRVLMLTQFYPPVLGGEEVLVQNLSLELVRRGHDVAVLTLWQEGSVELEVDRGVRIYRVRGSLQRVPHLYRDGVRKFPPPFPDPELTLAIWRVLQRERPQIVHAHNWLVHSFLPLKAVSGSKLVLSLHDYSLSCAVRTWMHRGQPCSGPGLGKCLGCATDLYGAAKGLPTGFAHRLLGPVLRHSVDLFLPISQFVAAASGLPEFALPYRVIPEFVADNVDSPFGDGQPWMSQLPPDGYLLFVGAFRRVKGIEVLLRAYSALQDRPPLVIIGYTCPEPGGPITFPSNVTVLRNWPNSAVLWAWRHSLMAIVPSIWPEPFGIVALEAMAAGRPVIASRIGGLAELVLDGESGLLVPPGEPDALLSAIERLLGDAALREAMGRAGLRHLTAFKAAAVVSRFEQAYGEVLDAGGSTVDRQPAAALAGVP